MGAAVSLYYGQSPISRIILDAFYDKRSAIFAYTGWNGVGMSLGAKAVAKVATESNLFNPVVLVTAGESCNSLWKLQRKIAEQLGFIIGHKEGNNDDIDEEEEEVDEEVAGMIYRSLTGRNFLLIIDKLLQTQGINDELGSIGVPTTTAQWIRSKILITTPNFQVIRAMNISTTFILHSNVDDRSNVPSDIGRVKEIELGGVNGLLEHFRDGAGDAANTLGISDQAEQVFNCCFYLSLFQQTTSTSTSTCMDAKELLKYYVGEGFVTSTQQQQQQQLNGLEGLEGAFRHGEAVLAQLVSRYMVVETSSLAATIASNSKIFLLNSRLWTILDGHPIGRGYRKKKLHIHLEVAAAGNSMLENYAVNARWVSLSHNKIQAVNHLPPLFMPATRCAHQLSTLLLNDNPQLKQIPDTFFHQMPNLKVLDLSRTSISSFPPSFSSVVDLRFLKLQECPYLEALPPSLKYLKQLIILDLHGTPLISIPSEALEQKTNLRFIDLSHTNINHSSLPPSFSALCNLEKLLLAKCNELEGLVLTSSQLRQLSELDISGCEALKDVENISFQDLPKLRALNLSYTPIACLSITRCISLEMVRLQGLTNLKSLQLSNIKIKEFPHEISELTHLEELHLIDVKQLRRVEWEKMQWLPKKLEWDECGCCSSSKLPAANNLLLLLQLEEELGGENRGGGAFISVSNAKIFEGLSSSSALWTQSLLKFHICITPCIKQQEKKQKQTKAGVGVRVVDGRKQQAIVVAYAGIYSKMKTDRLHYVGRRRDFSRRLEIEGGISLSRGHGHGCRRLVETVVRRAEVLWLHENGLVKSLWDLINVEEMEGVKECWVERCHNIDILFPHSSLNGGLFPRSSLNGDIQIPSQRLWVSELGSLRSVHDGSRDFRSLKHLHIQCCPKLDTLFPVSLWLRQLETLDIRFCTRLESVFKSERPAGVGAFPILRRLCLWELPKLKQIFEYGSLHSLEYLKVRGCPHLQHLPWLDLQKVKKIEGESEWWRNLRWDDNETEMKDGLNLLFQRQGGTLRHSSNNIN